MSHNTRLVRHGFQALGSSCELLALDIPVSRLVAGEQWVRQAERRFTRFEPDSELSALNDSGGEWTGVSPAMGRMLSACLDAYARSGGLVNAAVLPALIAAGYSRRFTAGLSAPEIFDPRPLPPLPEVLEVDDGKWARLAPGSGLDLGGIAKGVLADELAERVGENVVCNLGGDLRVRGPGFGDGWQIGLPDGRTVSVTDAALATSGTTHRRWGDGLHHLIDPRTGAPAVTDIAMVTVEGEDALSAEIFAKTALLLGAVEGARFLEARHLFHLIAREQLQ